MTTISKQDVLPHRVHAGRLVMISQKVQDISVYYDSPQLSMVVGSLHTHLLDHKYVRSEKISGSLTPIEIDSETGILKARLSGSSLMPDTAKRQILSSHANRIPVPFETSIDVSFPLGLVGYQGPRDIQSIFESVDNTRLSDGGNVQNMALNIGIIMAGLREIHSDVFGPAVLDVVMASSSDPFEKLPESLRAVLADIIRFFKLEMPDRYAIQVPCQGIYQRVSITSEPSRTGGAVEALIQASPDFKEAFENATCFVSSDPLFATLHEYAQPPFAYVINSATAFRTLVAAEAYGNHVVLAQNNKEAADVLRLLMARGYQQELVDTKELPFPSPIKSDGSGIDYVALKALDNSLSQFRVANPLFQRPGVQSFDYPFTFGPEGGLVIGSGGKTYAVFLSTPTDQGEQDLLSFATESNTLRDQTNEVGAGDAVASVVALFNTVDPEPLIVQKMRGDQARIPDLIELASTIFVGILSRLAGNLLVRTPDTFLSNIDPKQFAALVDYTAGDALQMADTMYKMIESSCFGVLERWGIKIVMWVPGQLRLPRNLMAKRRKHEKKVRYRHEN